MSWLFGILAPEISEKTVSRSRAIHGGAIDTFVNHENFYFAIGGLPATCLSGRTLNGSEEIQSFWVSLGCAFGKNEAGRKLFGRQDWSEIKEEDIGNLDGHFVHLRFEKGRFQFLTDRLGLRTLYWAESSGEIVVCTRIDWVTSYLAGRSIDFEKLGSRWLLYNQLTYESLVQGVQRLGPSGRLMIERGTTASSCKPFEPDFSQPATADRYIELLWQFLHPKKASPQTLSLGLSGGLDSRTLLSMLLHSGRDAFQTHSFGVSVEPDVSIAATIAKSESIRHLSYDVPLPTVPKTISLLDEYIAQTNLVEPGHGVLKLRQYDGLDAEKYYVVDGAFGEISRRQYMNRLLLGGKRAIAHRNLAAFKKTLAFNRGDIFIPEVNARMKQGVERELAEMLDTMPDPNRIGIGNYLDLWVVRTRIPNYGCDEQARVDGIILNYMPFAQPSLINSVFGIPVRFRRNSRIFREIIAQYWPALAEYPLVKNNATFPFNSPRIVSMIMARFKIRFGYAYVDPSPHIILTMLKEFILDLLHSKETMEYPAYNHAKISKKIHDYYSGAEALSHEVSWWLTFELWRRRIER